MVPHREISSKILQSRNQGYRNQKQRSDGKKRKQETTKKIRRKDDKIDSKKVEPFICIIEYLN